jgi:hypothetical protein
MLVFEGRFSRRCRFVGAVAQNIREQIALYKEKIAAGFDEYIAAPGPDVCFCFPLSF